MRDKQGAKIQLGQAALFRLDKRFKKIIIRHIEIGAIFSEGRFNRRIKVNFYRTAGSGPVRVKGLKGGDIALGKLELGGAVAVGLALRGE